MMIWSDEEIINKNTRTKNDTAETQEKKYELFQRAMNQPVKPIIDIPQPLTPPTHETAGKISGFPKHENETAQDFCATVQKEINKLLKVYEEQRDKEKSYMEEINICPCPQTYFEPTVWLVAASDEDLIVWEQQVTLGEFESGLAVGRLLNENRVLTDEYRYMNWYVTYEVKKFKTLKQEHESEPSNLLFHMCRDRIKYKKLEIDDKVHA